MNTHLYIYSCVYIKFKLFLSSVDKEFLKLNAYKLTSENVATVSLLLYEKSIPED